MELNVYAPRHLTYVILIIIIIIIIIIIPFVVTVPSPNLAL